MNMLEKQFNRALHNLKDIPNIRINKEWSKLKTIESTIQRISLPFDDDLFSQINIYPEDYFNKPPKEILKKLMNYLHSSRDVCLAHYIDFLEKADDAEEIKITNLRIILTAYIKACLNSTYMSLGRATYNNYLIELEVLSLKDLSAMGYNNILPFRYFDTKKTVYVDERLIKDQINTLNRLYSSPVMPQKLSSSEIENMKKYANAWWNQYRKYIDTFYYEIRNFFEYYNGISFKFIVCQSIVQSNVVDTESGLVSYEVKSRYKNNIRIEVDDNVYDKFFFENETTENRSLLGTLGYTKETYEDIFNQASFMIENEVNTELLDIIHENKTSELFFSLTDLLLSSYGINKYKFEECYVYRTINSKQPQKIGVFQYNKDVTIRTSKIEKHLQEKKYSNVVIIYEGLFPIVIKKHFRKNNSVILLDSKDIWNRLKTLLNESFIAQTISLCPDMFAISC